MNSVRLHSRVHTPLSTVKPTAGLTATQDTMKLGQARNCWHCLSSAVVLCPALVFTWCLQSPVLGSTAHAQLQDIVGSCPREHRLYSAAGWSGGPVLPGLPFTIHFSDFSCCPAPLISQRECEETVNHAWSKWFGIETDHRFGCLHHYWLLYSGSLCFVSSDLSMVVTLYTCAHPLAHP